MDQRLRFIPLQTSKADDYNLLMECAKATNLEMDVQLMRRLRIMPFAGMYVLEENNNVLCCVLCLKVRQLASIYVPAARRHQGHATTMLHKLVDLYRPLIEKWSCGFWCPVSPDVGELFIKAGWIAVTTNVASDGSVDHSPLWCKDLFMNDPSDYEALIADTIRLNLGLIKSS